MKVIFLSFSDYKGGASMASHSLFKAINYKNSYFLTVYKKFKSSIGIYSSLNKFYIYLLRMLEKVLIFFFCKKKYHQSLNIFNSFKYKDIKRYYADIINIHWINRSMLSLKELNLFKEKIVISLHDMWFLNSTEHYFDQKILESDLLSKYVWKQKKQILFKKNVFFIAHNKWMFKKFLQSFPLLKKKIFLSNFYPIDTDIFKPRNKIQLRKKYNIPANKKVILFSAQDMHDERKGFVYFRKIIKKLSDNHNFYFISLGKKNFDLSFNPNHKHIDFLSNIKTAEIYSLSDIYICTSIIDNLPLTILEALSSGNLVISFKNGGSDEVLDGIGYTFKISEIDKMIKLIAKLDNKKIVKKSFDSRKFAKKNFDQKKIGKQYLTIFKKINKLRIN